MQEKLKSNLIYLICGGLGVLNFVLFAFPYISAFADSGYLSYSSGISGYSIMDLWPLGFGGVFSSLIQICLLILGIALLALGACGLLKAFDILPQFPDKMGTLESKKLGEYGLFGMAGGNVLLLIFLIITCVSNTESYSSYGVTASAGYSVSAGIFISLILTVGAAVAYKLLEKKMPAESGETVTYACGKCGKRASSKDRFCRACGGEVRASVSYAKEYVCEKCGRRGSSKDKFCRECGGEIKAREKRPAETKG